MIAPLIAWWCVADRPEATVNHVDSDVEIPADTVQRTIRKLELVIYLDIVKLQLTNYILLLCFMYLMFMHCVCIKLFAYLFDLCRCFTV